MTKKQKKLTVRILVSCTSFIAVLLLLKLLPDNLLFLKWLYLIPYLSVGYTVIGKAVRNIIGGQLFDENFLMMLATVGAIAIGELPEAVFVMLFYQIGELFESIAVGKSRRSISELMDLNPDHAVIEKDGKTITVSPDEVSIGDILVVSPGEKIALDGTVVFGESGIDISALTGESVPREVSVGDKVSGGCINLSGLIRVKVEKPFCESTASKILRLVEEASANKARIEGFITRFAAYYTPVVVILALAIAIIPTLIFSDTKWIYTALNFLVISCPCALVISVPLSFFAGIGAASKNGILVKGSDYLEQLSKCKTAVFDKTGTLTEGKFRVTRVVPNGISEERLLEISAYAESFSNHPIALSLISAYRNELDQSRLGKVTSHAGKGLCAEIDGILYLVGNSLLMSENSVAVPAYDGIGTVVYVAENDKYLGHIEISDTVKAGVPSAVSMLGRLGVDEIVMLSGDNCKTAEAIAREVGVTSCRAELLPSDKVTEIEKLIEAKNGIGTVIFTGDGINDAPVLTRADVGIAMGALGSDAAIEAADIVIMNDDITKLPLAIRIARRTVRIVRENIIFSLAVKASVLILSLSGLCPMWTAIFADVGVMVLAVINAMRALKI